MEEPLSGVDKESSLQAVIRENPNTLSKVVLTVEGMSCSGCILTIESSLSDFDGIGDILVDVSGGKAEIYYDSGKLQNVDQIAAAITANGYPAKIDRIVSPEEVRKERDLMATRSKLHIASVGGADIPKSEFNTELTHAKTRYERTYGDEVFARPRGRALEESLKAQIASRLVDEGIQMHEIQAAGYKLGQEKLNEAFHEFLNKKNMTPDDFEASLEENGYSMEPFMKRFERRVIIQSYLDERVLDGISDQRERRQRYADWFGNAKLLAKVVYYDKALERLVMTKAAGCGGCASGQKPGTTLDSKSVEAISKPD